MPTDHIPALFEKACEVCPELTELSGVMLGRIDGEPSLCVSWRTDIEMGAAWWRRKGKATRTITHSTGFASMEGFAHVAHALIRDACWQHLPARWWENIRGRFIIQGQDYSDCFDIAEGSTLTESLLRAVIACQEQRP